MEGVHIRRATTEDRDAILDISDTIYRGVDYLQAFLDEIFINCDKSTPYVAVYNDGIIGFASAFLVDNGHTVVSRAGRVKEEFAGQGVYKMLSDHLLKASGAEVHASVIGTDNTTASSGSFQKTNTLIDAKLIVRYNIPLNTIHLTEEPDSESSAPATLTEDRLNHFFTTEGLREYLFPTNRIMVMWVPYKLLQPNIPIIWMRDNHSFRLTDARMEQDGTVKGLMTIGTEYFAPSGLFVYHIDVYGVDKNSLKRHIAYHLKFFCTRSDGEASILLTFDSKFDTVAFEKGLAEFGLTKMALEPITSYSLSLFEQQIQTQDKVE